MEPVFVLMFFGLYYALMGFMTEAVFNKLGFSSNTAPILTYFILIPLATVIVFGMQPAFAIYGGVCLGIGALSAQILYGINP